MKLQGIFELVEKVIVENFISGIGSQGYIFVGQIINIEVYVGFECIINVVCWYYYIGNVVGENIIGIWIKVCEVFLVKEVGVVCSVEDEYVIICIIFGMIVFVVLEIGDEVVGV